jgi:elongation factor P
MKTAQELRVGNVVMINNTPMVILKSEYSKGGRGASTVKLKMKNLLSNGGTETVYRADDRFEDIILDKKEVSYSYFGDPLYVWMDDEYNQYEVEAEVMEDVLKYLEDGMKAEVVLYVLSPSNSRQSWFVKLFTPNLQLRVILPAKS